MRHTLLCIATGVLMALLYIVAVKYLGAQTEREVPICAPGQCRDDATGGDRAGQPQWCQNKAERGFKANCKCTRSCDRADRGAGCATYCRTRECRCDHGCPMTR